MLVVSPDHKIKVKYTFLHNFSHVCTVGRDEGIIDRVRKTLFSFKSLLTLLLQFMPVNPGVGMQNHYTIKGTAEKKFCSMKDDDNCKNN